MKVHRVPLCFAAVPPSIAIKRSRRLFLIQSVLKPRAVRITMFSNYNRFVQKGYGNFEDDESSQESEQSSQSQVKSSQSLFKHGKIHQEFKIKNNLTT